MTFQYLKSLRTDLFQSQCVLHKHEILICGGYDHRRLRDSNEVTLLSFGGKNKHTLMMKYASVWSNDNEISKSKKSKKCNQWIPFTDKHNRVIQIGRKQDDYQGVRAVIGGSNNNLLFITYYRSNIS
ncbi:hypothetical protein RFI_20792, partial [Reticulomyxa filosa]